LDVTLYQTLGRVRATALAVALACSWHPVADDDGGPQGDEYYWDATLPNKVRPPHHLLDLDTVGQPGGVLQLRGRGLRLIGRVGVGRRVVPGRHYDSGVCCSA
jgi:hypothetical protein